MYSAIVNVLFIYIFLTDITFCKLCKNSTCGCVAEGYFEIWHRLLPKSKQLIDRQTHVDRPLCSRPTLIILPPNINCISQIGRTTTLLETPELNKFTFVVFGIGRYYHVGVHTSRNLGSTHDKFFLPEKLGKESLQQRQYFFFFLTEMLARLMGKHAFNVSLLRLSNNIDQSAIERASQLIVGLRFSPLKCKAPRVSLQFGINEHQVYKSGDLKNHTCIPFFHTVR